MKHNEDLNQIRIFTAVAELLSYTKAANALSMEKSSVSSKIIQLETRLGVRLLQRTTRRVSLTEAGQGYLSYCHKALSAIQEGEAFIESLSHEPKGKLRISAPQNYLDLILDDVIRPFLCANPKVSIEFVQSNDFVDLIQENFDIALRAGSPRLSDSSLISRIVLKTELVLAAGNDYLNKRGHPTSAEDLPQHDFIGNVSDSNQAHRPFNMLWNSDTFSPNFRFTVNGMLGVRSALLANLGFALVPKYLIKDAIASGQLTTFEAFSSDVQGIVHMVYPSRIGQPAKSKAFIEYLLAWGESQSN